jgi:hypothetical protein
MFHNLLLNSHSINNKNNYLKNKTLIVKINKIIVY